MSHDLPRFATILLERRERLLVLTLNRPDALNAVNLELHDELPEALAFAGRDLGSDVVLLTGAGRAFSAGGDISHMEHNAANPHLFDHEAGRPSGSSLRCWTLKSRSSAG
jgi:enoyl-CoA hydratase